MNSFVNEFDKKIHVAVYKRDTSRENYVFRKCIVGMFWLKLPVVKFHYARLGYFAVYRVYTIELP